MIILPGLISLSVLVGSLVVVVVGAVVVLPVIPVALVVVDVFDGEGELSNSEELHVVVCLKVIGDLLEVLLQLEHVVRGAQFLFDLVRLPQLDFVGEALGLFSLRFVVHFDRALVHNP